MSHEFEETSEPDIEIIEQEAPEEPTECGNHELHRAAAKHSTERTSGSRARNMMHLEMLRELGPVPLIDELGLPFAPESIIPSACSPHPPFRFLFLRERT